MEAPRPLSEMVVSAHSVVVVRPIDDDWKDAPLVLGWCIGSATDEAYAGIRRWLGACQDGGLLLWARCKGLEEADGGGLKPWQEAGIRERIADFMISALWLDPVSIVTKPIKELEIECLQLQLTYQVEWLVRNRGVSAACDPGAWGRSLEGFLTIDGRPAIQLVEEEREALGAIVGLGDGPCPVLPRVPGWVRPGMGRN